jgi:hypothetical protein
MTRATFTREGSRWAHLSIVTKPRQSGLRCIWALCYSLESRPLGAFPIYGLRGAIRVKARCSARGDETAPIPDLTPLDPFFHTHLSRAKVRPPRPR